MGLAPTKPSASCPRCGGIIDPTSPSENGVISCAGCGARLRAPSARAADGDPVLAELRALRAAQEDIAAMLREVLAIVRPPIASASPRTATELFPPVAAPRPETTARQPVVVIIDDDSKALQEAQTAFTTAQASVHGFSDGHAALPFIAARKPAAIIVEPEIVGPMAGGDIINMIRSTMEWVNIPLVLYSRCATMTVDDARAQGGDDLVLKTAGTQALVERVTGMWREA